MKKPEIISKKERIAFVIYILSGKDKTKKGRIARKKILDALDKEYGTITK